MLVKVFECFSYNWATLVAPVLALVFVVWCVWRGRTSGAITVVFAEFSTSEQQGISSVACGARGHRPAGPTPRAAAPCHRCLCTQAGSSTENAVHRETLSWAAVHPPRTPPPPYSTLRLPQTRDSDTLVLPTPPNSPQELTYSPDSPTRTSLTRM